jgi:hypothetical protein
VEEDELKRKHIKSFVNHPKYGNTPIITNYKLSEKESQYLDLKFGKDNYFSNTAILANVSKQNFGFYGLELYVDTKVRCRDCERPFIFFALQQQYWFETLKFWIDSRCVRCYECYQNRKEIIAWQKTYQILSLKEDKTNDELKKLKQVALELYQIGVIKKSRKLLI